MLLISNWTSHYFFFIFAGPDLPIELQGHSMVLLGLGQAILGGKGANFVFRNEIYHFTCYQQDCTISLLEQLLETPRAYFVAIPIPDSISGCISDSKFGFFHYLFCGKSKEKE